MRIILHNTCSSRWIGYCCQNLFFNNSSRSIKAKISSQSKIVSSLENTISRVPSVKPLASNLPQRQVILFQHSLGHEHFKVRCPKPRSCSDFTQSNKLDSAIHFIQIYRWLCWLCPCSEFYRLVCSLHSCLEWGFFSPVWRDYSIFFNINKNTQIFVICRKMFLYLFPWVAQNERECGERKLHEFGIKSFLCQNALKKWLYEVCFLIRRMPE